MKLGDSFDDILRELRAQAAAQYGEERAAELEESLEQTARQIWDVDQPSAHADLEPGFYQ